MSWFSRKTIGKTKDGRKKSKQKEKWGNVGNVKVRLRLSGR